MHSSFYGVEGQEFGFSSFSQVKFNISWKQIQSSSPCECEQSITDAAHDTGRVMKGQASSAKI